MVSSVTAGIVCGTTRPPSGASPSSRTSEKFDGTMPPRVDTYCIALVFVDEIANLDNFIAAWTNAHTGNTHARHFFQRCEIGLRVLGEFLKRAGTRDIFVARLGVVEVGLCLGHRVVTDAVDVLGHTARDVFNAG